MSAFLHRVVEFVRRLVAAVQHVRTDGRTTRTRAVRRASSPPSRCATCRQEVPHSDDWRDHLTHEHRPDAPETP